LAADDAPALRQPLLDVQVLDRIGVVGGHAGIGVAQGRDESCALRRVAQCGRCGLTLALVQAHGCSFALAASISARVRSPTAQCVGGSSCTMTRMVSSGAPSVRWTVRATSRAHSLTRSALRPSSRVIWMMGMVVLVTEEK